MRDGSIRPDLLADLATLTTLASTEFAEAAHAAIDRRGLSRMTIAKRDAEVARLTREIRSVEGPGRTPATGPRTDRA